MEGHIEQFLPGPTAGVGAMTVWYSVSAFRAAAMQPARIPGCDVAVLLIRFASGFDAGDQGRLASACVGLQQHYPGVNITARVGSDWFQLFKLKFEVTAFKFRFEFQLAPPQVGN